MRGNWTIVYRNPACTAVSCQQDIRGEGGSLIRKCALFRIVFMVCQSLYFMRYTKFSMFFWYPTDPK